MSYVDVGHQQIVVANARDQAAAFGAAMNGDKFADAVAGADARFGALALIFQVLRSYADGCVRIENILLADPGGSFGVDVGHQSGARADLNFLTDDAIRADVSGRGDARFGMDDGGGVDGHSLLAAALPAPRMMMTRGHDVCASFLSASLHITSASATSRPSTVARPAIFATLALRLMTVISIRN